MKTSTFAKRIPMFPRAGAAAGALLVALAVCGGGCIGGFNNENLSEGDRCNPLDSHNECSAGMICTGPQGGNPAVPFCPENYCCSVDGNGNIRSSNPNCQPGCNGGAAAICAATMDPGACAVADGGMPPPEAGGSDASGE